MRTYFVYSCVVMCLVGLLSPLTADGQGLGGLGGLLQDKDKSKKGGGVFGFEETLEMLFEDAAATLGIATQESLLKSYSEEGLKHEQNHAWNDAIASYTQAVELLENLRGEVKSSDTKESLVERYLWIYKRLVKLFLQQDSPENAFMYAERSKARSFLDQLAEAGAGIRKGIDPDLLAEEQQLHQRLGNAWGSLGEKIKVYNQSTSQPQRAALEEELKTLQQQIDDLEQDLDRLQETMRRRNPRYAALKYPQPISLNEVQGMLLKEGESLLECFWGETELYLFVIGQKNFHVLTIPVKEQETAKRIEQLLTPFRKIGRSQSLEETLKQVDLNLAYELYQRIVQPAESYLQGIHTLLVVPDGALHYLPFEMFVTQQPEIQAKGENVFSRYHEASYLIRRYAMVYAPSASVLKPDLLYHVQDAGQPEHTFLALAPFSEGKLAQSAPVIEAMRELTIVENNQRGQNFEFSPLSFSKDEVKTIASLFPSSCQYFLGSEATEQIVHQQGADYRFVHLATHGLIDPEHPMYSGIAFYDGLLQMYETFNLELRADLVALSACETGLGALKRGEGLIGLTRAFMYAGTPSVLVSLWSVDDQSTSYLMTEFYRRLNAGCHKAEALRQAKLALLEQQREQHKGISGNRNVVVGADQQPDQVLSLSHAHPFYWAPFVLSGGWR